MITESDTELLEAYLDDALSDAEVEVVGARLSVEFELAENLRQLRAERALRAAVWQSASPDAEVSDRLASFICRASKRYELKRRVLHGGRIAATAAACIVAGFFAGWLGRGGQHAPMQSSNLVPAAKSQVIGQSGQTVVSSLADGSYQVALTDQSGHVVAIQKMPRLEDAWAFAADIARSEERRKEVQDGQPLLVSSEF